MICNVKKFQGSLDEESLDVLEKMRRKNEKRLKRMKEIEKDKLMFSWLFQANAIWGGFTFCQHFGGYN